MSEDEVMAALKEMGTEMNVPITEEEYRDIVKYNMDYFRWKGVTAKDAAAEIIHREIINPGITDEEYAYSTTQVELPESPEGA